MRQVLLLSLCLFIGGLIFSGNCMAYGYGSDADRPPNNNQYGSDADRPPNTNNYGNHPADYNNHGTDRYGRDDRSGRDERECREHDEPEFDLNEDAVVRYFSTIEEVVGTIPFDKPEYDLSEIKTSYSKSKKEIIRLLRIPGNFPTGSRYTRYERDTRSFKTVSNATVHDIYDATKPGQLIEAHVDSAFEVNIYSPSKRSAWRGNNDVYVHNCTFSWTEPYSKRRREESRNISSWIRRGSNKIISLPEVATNVHIQLRCAAKPRRGGQTVLKLQVSVPNIIDDEENPNFDIISRLNGLGSLPTTSEELQSFVETLHSIRDDIEGVQPIADGKLYELRRKLEYVKYLLGGRIEDVERAKGELDSIIDEFCGEPR